MPLLSEQNRRKRNLLVILGFLVLVGGLSAFDLSSFAPELPVADRLHGRTHPDLPHGCVVRVARQQVRELELDQLLRSLLGGRAETPVERRRRHLDESAGLDEE